MTVMDFKGIKMRKRKFEPRIRVWKLKDKIREEFTSRGFVCVPVMHVQCLSN